jgi:PAS domain S-box-containing protein
VPGSLFKTVFPRGVPIALVVALTLACAITLLLALMGAMDYLEKRDSSRENLAADISNTARQLALSLANPIWNFQDDLVWQIMESGMLPRDIAAVAVEDSIGHKPVFVCARDENWRVSRVDSLPTVRGGLTASQDVAFGGRVIARVVVVGARDFVEKSLREFFWSLVVRIALIDALFIAMAYLVLFRVIVGPLQRVKTYAAGARLMGGGDGFSQVDSRVYEISELGGSIARMVGEIASQYNTLAASREELVRANELTRAVLDSMPAAIIAVDASGRVAHWNIGASSMAGVDREEAVGRLLVDVMPELKRHERQLGQAMRENRIVQAPQTPLRFEAKEPFTASVQFYPLFVGGLSGAVVRISDITERMRMQEVVARSERMASIAGLAAGMAHEINNPLAGIMQNAQVLVQRVNSGAPANEQAARESGCTLEGIRAFLTERKILSMIEAMRDAAVRAAQIVTTMLEFSRKSDSSHEPVDIVTLIEDAIKLSSTDYNLKTNYAFKAIDIIRQFDPDVGKVRCSKSQILQVLLNLFGNAAQALAGGAETGARPEIVIRAASEDGAVRLEVEDNGPGMEEDVRRRAFEPFFTTKPPGEGTGLGLSVSHFIVTHNHGGTMTVDSAPGKGARFTILLPVKPGG